MDTKKLVQAFLIFTSFAFLLLIILSLFIVFNNPDQRINADATTAALRKAISMFGMFPGDTVVVSAAVFTINLAALMFIDKYDLFKKKEYEQW